MFLYCKNKKNCFNEESKKSYLEARTECYENLRVIFASKTPFKDRLSIAKTLCEKHSYFSECLISLLMIFYLLPHAVEAKDYFHDISNLYLQICEYFPYSDYFPFFNIQMARFLCQLPIGNQLKYFEITDLVLKNILEKTQDKEKKDYLLTPWETKD